MANPENHLSACKNAPINLKLPPIDASQNASDSDEANRGVRANGADQEKNYSQGQKQLSPKSYSKLKAVGNKFSTPTKQ